MAVLVVTAANVKPSAGAIRRPDYAAGVAITAGQAIYLDSAQLWQLANTGTALGVAVPTAIAGNTAAVGQRVDAIIEDPDFTHGLTGVVAGGTLWGHPSAGGITTTDADNVTGNFVTHVGICISATKARIRFLPSNVAK